MRCGATFQQRDARPKIKHENRIETLTFALREVVETVGALVTQFPAEILLARALSAGGLALPVPGAVQEAVAGRAVGVTVVSLAAPVAVGRGVRRFALALAEALRAVSGRVEIVAPARCETRHRSPVNRLQLSSTITISRTAFEFILGM